MSFTRKLNYQALLHQNQYSNNSERSCWQENPLRNRYNYKVKVNNWSEDQRDINAFYHSLPKPKAFPGQQPDLPLLKYLDNTYETTYRAAYQAPQLITARKPDIQCRYCRRKRP